MSALGCVLLLAIFIVLVTLTYLITRRLTGAHNSLEQIRQQLLALRMEHGAASGIALVQDFNNYWESGSHLERLRNDLAEELNLLRDARAAKQKWNREYGAVFDPPKANS